MSMQVTKVWWDGEKLMAEPIPESEIYKESAQQDPVAVVASHPERIDWLRDEPPDGTLLYTSPPAQQDGPINEGGHVPAVPVAVYGYCPECGGAGVMRERRPNGDDKCTNGHKYPSSKALAEQPAQKRPQNCGTGYCSCIECVMEPAQPQAYEKANPLGGPAKVFNAMANAIRAGDSYPAVLRQYGYAEAAQPQQEPVAWAFLIGQYAHIVWGKQRPDDEIHTIPLYPSPQPCPTCEALVRTVMLDQTSHDAQRKPLTDEMAVAAARVLSDRQAAACNVDCGDMWKMHGNDFLEDARAALEAAHGIKGDA